MESQTIGTGLKVPRSPIMVHGILSLTFDCLAAPSRGIPEASFKCTSTCSPAQAGSLRCMPARTNTPRSSWACAWSFAACSQLNTASKHAEHHLPCNDGQNFMCVFPKIFFFISLKKPLNLINCICSSSGAFFLFV